MCIRDRKKYGIKVETFDVPAMRKLGMNALLGVGQGSAHDSRMVVMRWNGGKPKDAPLAVVGMMQALAKRKARVNVVGLIGIVENMPDGNAQRPNDIVRTMSGQTIEV